MDTRFIETLIATVEEGTLAAAARRQGITAAAAAQRVAALERQLNVPLLVRDGRRMAATPDCAALLSDFRQLVALSAGLAGRLAEDRLGGTLRLGAISTALSDFGAPLLQVLRKDAPAVELSVIPASSEDLFSQFEAGSLDAALLVAPPFPLPKTMRFAPLAHQAIGQVTHPEGRDDAPFILYSRGSWGGALCWQALSQNRAASTPLCEMDAVEIIAQMVADGLGQAVLPNWAGLARHHSILRFRAIPDAQRTVGLLTWRRDDRRPVIAFLSQSLAAQAQQAQRS